MPEEGVEPTRPCDQRILSPPRLPFRHSGVATANGSNRGPSLAQWADGLNAEPGGNKHPRSCGSRRHTRKTRRRQQQKKQKG
jgi:hypothetical protein